MSSKTTLNEKNLEALGAKRLAKLMIEISTGNAATKRKIRLALAGAQSPKEAAREITRRMTSIAQAQRFVTWKNRKGLVDDLKTQRRAIMKQVAPDDPTEALSLLWRFMGLAPSVFQRCDDSSGTVRGIFEDACEDLGKVAEVARTDPRILAETTFNALQANEYCQYENLITYMSPALGEDGLVRLKALVEEVGKTPVSKSTGENQGAGDRDSKRYAYEQQILERSRSYFVTKALREIADARDDVDGYIAQFEPKMRKNPGVSVGIARRLLASGRAADALGFIDGTEYPQNYGRDLEWENVRVEVLEALGRSEEAQTFRCSCFERHLSIEHLRAYLKHLPDFDDVEAEERAMAHAMAHRSLPTALYFFINWPAPDRAAELLMTRHDEIKGGHFSDLTRAAEVLSERHPLAATLALRSMIDHTLVQKWSKQYPYAVEDLRTCARLAPDINDFGAFETHKTYVARLKVQHGRKYRFWSILADGGGVA